jgi:pyruvate dehydrogenase E2 component (dihydrolipoamide acetyltransferase)
VTEFKVPELGENVTSADVSRLMVNVGDTIVREQPVLELETDKATVEVPSSVAGVITAIKVKKGDTVQVGAVVLTVDEGAADAAAGASAPEEAPSGGDDRTGTRDRATAATPATPATSRPAAAAAPAEPRDREEAEADRPEHAEHKVVSMPPRAAPAGRADPPEARTQTADAAPRAERGPAAPASPSVRRLAREVGVDVNDVQGTGPGGRISQDDVKEHARRILSSVGAAGGAPGGVRAVRPLPDFQKWGEVERQPWSNIRRTTADHLSHAWSVVPHVTQFDKADVTALEALRARYRPDVEKAGGSLTVTAILVKVVAAALRRFPQFNASLDVERGEIVFKQYVGIGVAVDTERGLLVPVIRDADRKNITQIAVELHALAAKARDRKLTLEEMSGGSLSVSNLGGIGGTYFTPIVNWPEVAILGVSRSTTEPVWRPSTDGQSAFEPREMLPLSLSYDHRVVDGADAIRFLRWVVEAIEQPFLLSLLG